MPVTLEFLISFHFNSFLVSLASKSEMFLHSPMGSLTNCYSFYQTSRSTEIGPTIDESIEDSDLRGDSKDMRGQGCPGEQRFDENGVCVEPNPGDGEDDGTSGQPEATRSLCIERLIKRSGGRTCSTALQLRDQRTTSTSSSNLERSRTLCPRSSGHSRGRYTVVRLCVKRQRRTKCRFLRTTWVGPMQGVASNTPGQMRGVASHARGGELQHHCTRW